ncbi:hypothetical protein OEZ85_011593 [Tetradesmus obliquus]|uniref:Fibronectin type-III domain-containing protein n=1 Tax=Tetradesmus obliquus TaxID=3088 RepID=A0ABY8TRJ9_TETOB|nr:hypothetical protein OEZ85_011593 [Tetradesmus obliquus]
MGQPYRCLAAWLLVAFTAIALAAPEDANSAAACSDQRPNQPQQLRLKAILNTSSIGALWEAPGNKACVDNYIVLVRPAAGASKEPSPHKVKSRSVIVSNLRPNTAYRVDVVPVSRKRGTGPFATATVTTLSGPSCNPKAVPGKAQQVKATPSSSRNDRVTVTWAPNSGGGNGCVNGYRVEGFDASNGAKVVSINLGRDVEELNVNGLIPGTKYNFIVIAKSNAAYSSEATDKMSLSWQNGDPGICTQAYKIDAYQLKTGDRVIGTETGFSSYTLTKLVPGVEYAFTVAAVNSKGDSIPATAMSSTPKNRR